MMHELVKRLRNCATQAAPCKTCDMVEDGSCSDTLMKQAADVRPVVRGEWIWFGDCANEGLYCSVCKNKIHEVRKPKKKLSNFCPNCGADMRPTSMSGANGEES